MKLLSLIIGLQIFVLVSITILGFPHLGELNCTLELHQVVFSDLWFGAHALAGCAACTGLFAGVRQPPQAGVANFRGSAGALLK